MTINKSDENGVVTLLLDGRLDTTTAPKLQEILIPSFADFSEVRLDFDKLVYVSSAGLRVLIMGEKKAKSIDKTMKIINVSDDIMEIFDMTGFTDILTIE
jgi:anti-anti-sigma factor